MPTPVGVARQCLTPEAAHALDEAVGVARRRGHGQTTSLHAVSALLSLPSSALREACARARNSAYSPRLQFKALDLCLSVSLDRVPSGQPTDDPPVSNSLMAAIKRSQANQRRQPENFHLYHQLSNQSSINAVKVELQHLMLSILDDPVVSRVFGEAGFRSSEIKLAIVRPLPHLFRYPRSRAPPPLFLCNLSETSGPGSASSRPAFNFPFSVFPGFSDGDENVRRIGEVMVRTKGRNPLLVGVCACEALKSFVECLDKRKDGSSLPKEISGLTVVSIENDVPKFVGEGFDKGYVDVRFEEVGGVIRQCLGSGVVVSFGDLRALIGDGVSYVVDRLTRLLEMNKGKVWLIGAAASYDTYSKFLSKFPAAEKDWDLQILPITTLQPSVAESCPRSSLMESFVPFGGFFPTSSDLNSAVMSMSYQCVTPCHLYDDKCEQDNVAARKAGCAASVADRYQNSLPSWLQMAELGIKGTDVKGKDDGPVRSPMDAELQNESDESCRHSPKSQPLQNDFRVGSEVQSVVGLQPAEERRETTDNQSLNWKTGIHLPPVPKTNKENFLSKLWENPSRVEDKGDSGVAASPKFSGSNSVVDDESRTSPASVTSVATSLGLGICSPPDDKELKQRVHPSHCRIPTSGDLFSGSTCRSLVESSSSSYHDSCYPLRLRDFKLLSGALMQKIGRQVEAINVISEKIPLCQSRNNNRSTGSRGDMWFTFLGLDKIAKRRAAVTLSEVLYGSKEHLIIVDLNAEHESGHADRTLSQEMNQYDVKYRGKTVVDIVAGEMRKKPLSVVLLENVDKADEQVQSSLSQARWTGKFADSHGREVSVKNALFVATSTFTKADGALHSGDESAKSVEERALGAKGCQMKILVEDALGDNAIDNHLVSNTSGISITNQLQVNKRKLAGSNGNVVLRENLPVVKRANKTSSRHLDLNLPAEGNEVVDADEGSTDGDVMNDNSKAWLLDFMDQMDATVVFKPYDFASLAEKILKEIKESFCKAVGSECLLEIDSKVMDQLLSAAYLSDGERTAVDWVKQTLSRDFAEAQRRHKLTSRSIVKLVVCDGFLSEEQETQTCLPTKLIID
ncbi:protein SMAX1-LIKE 6 isoform X2 [Rhodamnia argentea]|uniref:Protein SMAX1-LIKE 6 isoform X2 n=1 Tax=Rhodamnia argentea TaxID=178133 RepID=A0ABM3HT05_9MYRT|nr:protein SMAX1-LIKE 6 isoform X2 [Rhodamnia argentea]